MATMQPKCRPRAPKLGQQRSLDMSLGHGRREISGAFSRPRSALRGACRRHAPRILSRAASRRTTKAGKASWPDLAIAHCRRQSNGYRGASHLVGDGPKGLLDLHGVSGVLSAVAPVWSGNGVGAIRLENLTWNNPRNPDGLQGNHPAIKSLPHQLVDF